MRITGSDPGNIECRLIGGGNRLDVIAQASPQAWVQYDTTVVHLVQAFASGAVHDRTQVPRQMVVPGGQAAWVPAQDELIATNGTQSRAGSYVTVTVTHAAQHGAAELRLAKTVALATLASAPRGSNPGPPPS